MPLVHASVRRCGTAMPVYRTGVPQPTPHFSRSDALNLLSSLIPTSRSTSLPSLKNMTVGIAITALAARDFLVLVAIHFANLDFAFVVCGKLFNGGRESPCKAGTTGPRNRRSTGIGRIQHLGLPVSVREILQLPAM